MAKGIGRGGDSRITILAIAQPGMQKQRQGRSPAVVVWREVRVACMQC
jgi:hypothetical protein